MLFHHIRDPHSGVDIEQLVCSLEEDVNCGHLRVACERLVARYDVFRTSFQWEGLEQARQTVWDHVETPFATADLGALSPEIAAERLERALEEDRSAGFAPDRAPLCRFSLFRLGAANYKLIWTFHHAILDGRSFPIVLNELFALYDAQRTDTQVQLPERPSYSQYIEWLDTLDLGEAERFWRGYLDGFRLATAIPALDGVTPGESGHSAEQVTLSSETTTALQEFAARQGATLNTMVQAAWALILSRYTASPDVVFGATRACRNFHPDASGMVGTFINTLPVRFHVEGAATLSTWLKQIRAPQAAIRNYEHTSLASVQAWSEVPRGASLFESILVFDYYDLNAKMRAQGGNWTHRQVHLRERTNYPLTLYAYADTSLTLRLAFDRSRFNAASVRRTLGHLKTLLEAMPAAGDCPLSKLPMLTAEELRRHAQWNDTHADYPRAKRVHDWIEEQAERSPEAIALVFRDRQLTYRELDARANQLAHLLRFRNVQAGDRVAVSLERSPELVIALLGTLKAGAAYVPIDPGYPAERKKYVLEDAHASVVITQEKFRPLVSGFAPSVVALDTEQDLIGRYSSEPVTSGGSSDGLAYVIYTSGSTGKPKGVMVSHRNVVNFFVGMDQKLGRDATGVWLAVTSISFDISVLELFWTLARGFRVVLQEEDYDLPSSPVSLREQRSSLEFSLFYFASEENAGHSPGSAYRLLLEGAKFADLNGFSAVWTPERHFHAFGGLFPNPSVTSAALAMITRNVKIRAGSVVLPLHDPIRVAEEWAVVDQLSHGRVGISFASGWHDRDFVLAPANYTDRKRIMQRDVEVVRSLWRGEPLRRQNGSAKEAAVSLFPRPIQPELPVWVTSGGDPLVFQWAGEIGANLLTHLLGQRIEDVAAKILIYRNAYRRAGHAGSGHVTLMLHTFVGSSDAEAEEIVRTPLCDYLKSSVDLMKQVVKGLGEEFAGSSLSREDLASLIDHAFHRYYATSGLFGTPESCLEMVRKLQEAGVDEAACLVDFGIPAETVLANLDGLRELAERVRRPAQPGYSIPEQILKHGVTHMQCTPSLARMLQDSVAGREGLAALRTLLVGGEALPPSLAAELQSTTAAEIYNMYGPTETTIWSTMEKLRPDVREVSIGRPIANTSVFVLDGDLCPVPVGVAGELYIGGDGVVPGYLDRPELTARRFVHLPFCGERAYRTGDLAKYLPDGRLQFLGRVDHQVKIRGHRVELGEIEAVLCQHAHVQEAVVAATQNEHGSALAAYVVQRLEAEVQPAELREFLASQLPSHMVPGPFVFLGSLPRTPNGKIDRSRLPGPDLVLEQRPMVAPRNPVEEKLATIWREALRVEAVGVFDNFFDLGGHSLTAVVVTGKIRRTLAPAFPLRTVLDHPTIAEVAEEIEKLQAMESPGSKPARPPIVRSPISRARAAQAPSPLAK